MEKSLKVYTSLAQMVEIVDTLAELTANTADSEELLGLLNGLEAIEDAICKLFEIQGIDPWSKAAKFSPAVVSLPKTIHEVALPNWDVELLRKQTTKTIQETSRMPKSSNRAILQMALLALENACSVMECTQSDQVVIDLRNITPQGNTHSLRGYCIMLEGLN